MHTVETPAPSSALPPGSVIFRRKGQQIPTGFLELDNSLIPAGLYPFIEPFLPSTQSITNGVEFLFNRPDADFRLSSYATTGGDINNLVDGDADTGWAIWGVPPIQWIQFYSDMGPQTVMAYQLSGSTSYWHPFPGWIFSGSNDGVNFVTLDEQTNNSVLPTETKSFVIANPGQYSYYRIRFQMTGYGASLSGVKLFKSGTAETSYVLKKDLPIALQYGNLNGGYINPVIDLNHQMLMKY